MFIAMILSLTLVLTTIVVHFEALRQISIVLPSCDLPGRSLVLLAVVGAFTAHLLEVVLYAGAFFLLEDVMFVGGRGGLYGDTFMDYLYYSTVMYTSLGVGEVFPVGHLRIISGIEALNGLIMIGWSTSFTFLTMRRYWPLDPDPC